MNVNNKALRKELLNYLKAPHTHAPLAKAVANFPEAAMNKSPKGIPYTFWMLLEHVRITQHDMLHFIRNSSYTHLQWPKDYWPPKAQRATKAMWNKSIKEYAADLAALEKIVKDPKRDILKPIPWGEGQTIFREVMQVIDHAAYHTGEFVLMRRAIGKWK
jgi:hypothetical protein